MMDLRTALIVVLVGGILYLLQINRARFSQLERRLEQLQNDDNQFTKDHKFGERLSKVQTQGDQLQKFGERLTQLETQMRSDVSRFGTLETRFDHLTDENQRLANRCPPQVAFSAYVNSLLTVPEGNIIKFDGIDVNIGAHFKEATSIFTCPISGTYSFSLVLQAERDHNHAYARIVKNGASVAFALASHVDT